MGDAPTTEEVREETERLRRELDGAAFERGSNERARRSSAERAMSAYALPIAEHRDALAAEVARLRPLAELGALALAWGRALRECETARTPRECDAADMAADTAGGKLVSEARRMAEEEQR